ncbi:MAG: hypothetical protein JXA77_13770 [Bacteroidales bacterium]|nr:hypothetical protein [Bacteroidales bacterium]MBN2819170.1 hypothetical protein [Bacteroidales bacterium]
MNKLLCLLLISLISFPLLSQKKTDVVYLHNGSIIKGKIVENLNGNIKIETCCGSIFAYRAEDIDKVATEKYVSANKLKEEGYFNFTSAGVLIGSNANERVAPFSLLMEHNYKIDKNIAFGGFWGYEILNESTLPIGFNIKGLIPLDRGSTIFTGISSGYSISLEKPTIDYREINIASGGILFQSEIGFVANSSKNASFYMALGYRYNTLNYELQDWYFIDSIKRKLTYNRISLRFGVCFH